LASRLARTAVRKRRQIVGRSKKAGRIGSGRWQLRKPSRRMPPLVLQIKKSRRWESSRDRKRPTKSRSLKSSWLS